jgi:hypothetical protein
MKLKDELAQHRLAIMRLRVRGMNTKPSNYLEDEINTLRELSTAVVRQRDDLVRTLDKAEAHIKFLEAELRARGEV